MKPSKQKHILIKMMGRNDCVLRLKIKTTKHELNHGKIDKDETIHVEYHPIPSTITNQDYDHGIININNNKLKPLLEGKLGCFSAFNNSIRWLANGDEGREVEIIGAKIIPTILL